MTAQISSLKSGWPQCSQCHAETSVDDSFCQECGTSLIGTSKSAVLPDMNRLHTSLAKPVVALPLIILAVAVFVFVPICLVGFEKSYSSFSIKYATEQASKSYNENHFDEAAVVLERLAISHKLDEEQRALLNNIYLARADQRANNLDYNNAISDLDKITPQFSKFVLVSLKKHEYFELLTKQQNRTRMSVAGNRSHLKIADHSKLHSPLKTTTSSTEHALVTTTPTLLTASPDTSATIVKAAPAMTTLSSGAKTVSSNSTLAATVASTIKAPSAATATSPGVFTTTTTAPMMAASPTATQSSAEKAHSQSLAAKVPKISKSIKYAENDMVRYNELLAGYFSQDRKTSSASAGPPSLKEWIDLGKPSF